MLWTLTRCFGVAWPRCMQPCFYFFNLEDIFWAFSRIRYTLTWYRRLFDEIFLFILWYAVSMVLHCLRLLSIPPKSPFSSFVINLSFYARENLHGRFWQILFNQPYTAFTPTKPPLFSISAMLMHEFIHRHSLTTSRSFQTYAWNPGVLACLISNLP